MSGVTLLADFECANSDGVRRVGENAFELRTRPDEAVDNQTYRHADYYFAFRLANPSASPADANVTVRQRDHPEAGRKENA